MANPSQNGSLWFCDAVPVGDSSATGGRELRIAADSGPAHLLLLGGMPLGEEIVMLWNFIGRDHADVLAMRNDWEDPQRREQRFGTVSGYGGTTTRIPAPPPPMTRLRPRKNAPAG